LQPAGSQGGPEIYNWGWGFLDSGLFCFVLFCFVFFFPIKFLVKELGDQWPSNSEIFFENRNRWLFFTKIKKRFQLFIFIMGSENIKQV